MQLPDIDLNSIGDPATRAVVQQLLLVIETQHTEIVRLRAENQVLRDENARRKGGSAKPQFPPPPLLTNRSSETERRTPKPHRKRCKLHSLQPTRTQSCRLDPACLPPDAQRRTPTVTLVQDLRLQAEVIAFERQTYDAASTVRTSTAPLPVGYHGAFGPHIRSLVAVLAHVTPVPPVLHSEAFAIVEAGLASSPWQQIDDTPTTVNGHVHSCQVLGNPLYSSYRTQASKQRRSVLQTLQMGNPLYSSYRTQASKQRRSVLQTLQNGRPLSYRLNSDALEQLQANGCPPAVLARLRTALPWDVVLDEQAVSALLGAVGRTRQRQIRDLLAIAAYQAQTAVPVVRLLVCDDAPQLHQLVDDLALCWVHEGRHLAALSPLVATHQRELRRVRQHFWAYYRALLAYQAQPDPNQRARLEASFTRLVSRRTAYAALQERLRLLASKRDSLLHVLAHPELPLHNNAMELAARRRVRKRDISFGPRSEAGVRAWDSCMTLVATAQKLGVNIISYLTDRISGACQLPALADLITQRAHTANLGASWATS